MPSSIRRWLPLSYALIALLAALALGAALLVLLRGYYCQREVEYMRRNARAIDEMVARLVALDASPAALESQLKSLAFLSQTRVRLLDEKGQVVADSGDPRGQVGLVMLSMVDSPPFRQTVTQTFGAESYGSVIALQDAASGTNLVERITISATLPGGAPDTLAGEGLGTDELGLASRVPAVGTAFGFGFDAEATSGERRSRQSVRLPLYALEGAPLGTLEVSEGPAYGREILRSVAWGWGIAAGLAVLLAAGAGWLVSRQITRPLSALTEVTERMAQGDLAARAQVRRKDELGRLARSFNEMAERVEGTIAALSRFVADAAHELATPLTAVRSHLELAPQDEFVTRALAQVGRLEALAQGLLNLSRIEADKHARALEPVALNALLGEVAETYASQAEQAGLAFELDVTDRPLVTMGHRAPLRDALGNLLDNACKFTPPGGSVRVSLGQEGEWAVFRVRDTGIGIPPEDLSHLFERFHRGRNAAAYPGSGLGLAIARAIVERYGGSIEAQNADPGSLFVLRLPVN